MNYLSKYLVLRYRITEEQSAIFRLLFGLHFLLFCGLKDFRWLAELPEFFYFPFVLSLPSALSTFPSATFFTLLQVVTTISFFALWVGFRTSTSSILFSLTQIILFSFQYSLGKIDHNMLHLSLPLFMAFSNWGNKLSLDELMGRKSHFSSSLGLSLLATALAFSFLTAAIFKMKGVWLNVDVLALNSIINRNGVEWLGSWPHPLLKSMDYLVILFELAFLLALPYPKAFIRVCLLAIPFHLLVALFLNIYFLALPLVYMAFFISKYHFPGFKTTHAKKPILYFLVLAFSLCLIVIFYLVKGSSYPLTSPILHHFMSQKLMALLLYPVLFFFGMWVLVTSSKVKKR